MISEQERTLFNRYLGTVVYFIDRDVDGEMLIKEARVIRINYYYCLDEANYFEAVIETEVGAEPCAVSIDALYLSKQACFDSLAKNIAKMKSAHPELRTKTTPSVNKLCLH